MTNNRIHLLDELRGLCVVLMVIYHALYTFATFFGADTALKLFNLCYPLEPFFAGIFVFLCGFSCRLSSNNIRRGLALAVVALGMTAVLYAVMPQAIIYFGVLHCLAVCILLYAAAKPLCDRVSPVVGFSVAAALFALTWTVPTVNGGAFLGLALPETLLACKWLFPIGFGRMYSADYFPLIPWLFCFAAGTFAGRWQDRLPRWCYPRHIRPLAFVGRHSLWIYLAHQPVIYGIATAVTWLG